MNDTSDVHERFGPHCFFTLKDGRKLSYSEFGDPNGVPIISCHGGLVCRLDIEHASECAKKMCVRIISIDRPGIGFSDFQPNREQLDWPNDVKELCDYLKIQHFSVLGWSLGGQYAVTCGYLLPDRVKKVGVIAGAIPIDSPQILSELNGMDRFFIKLSYKYPWLAKSIFKIGARLGYSGSKILLYFMRKRFSHHVSGITDWKLEHYATMFSEGVRNADGVIQEYIIFGKPWGFDPQDVKVSITWWYGEKDALVSPKWLPLIKQQFPQAKLVVYPNEGHFLATRHYQEILSELKF